MSGAISWRTTAMRSVTGHPIRTALIVLGTCVLVAGSDAMAQAWGFHHPKPPKPEEETLVGRVWRDLPAKDRAESLRSLPPAEAAALGRFLDKVAAGEPVPVSVSGQVVGVLDPDDLDGNRMPKSQDELAPIRDAKGETVAFWAGPMGVVDRKTADKLRRDLPAVAARRGLNPDGTVVTDLLDQIPVPSTIVLPPILERPPATVLLPPLSIRPPETKPGPHGGGGAVPVLPR
jgi:hypothetical protein